MFAIATPFNLFVILLWAGTAFTLGVYSYYRMRQVMRGFDLVVLIVVRVLVLSMLLLLGLQPYYLLTTPDPDAFKIKILSDCSGSMRTRDCLQKQSRISIVKSFLDQKLDKQLHSGLKKSPKTEFMVFAEQSYPAHSTDLSILPGNTAVGIVLAKELNTGEHLPVGAVLLMSDGHNNTGISPVEIAKKYRGAGIPVTCVGIGEKKTPGDLSVITPAKPVKGKKGKPVNLETKIKNTFNREMKGSVDLFFGKTKVQHKKFSVKANSVQNITFTVIPFRAGFLSYRLKINPPEEDNNPETDIDFISVMAKEPDLFKVLYLGPRLNWNFKFMKMEIEHSRQLKLDAIIKLAKDKFYHLDSAGKSEIKKDGFHKDFADYNQADVIVIDTDIVPELAPEVITAIEQFVTNRGGGLLCLGNLNSLPDCEFRKLLPVKETKESIPLRKQYLKIGLPFIFPDSQTQALRIPPGPYLPSKHPVFTMKKLKPGAREGLFPGSSKNGILSLHQYGAGRVAFLGSEAFWSWHLTSNTNLERYRTFWHHLLVWLSSTGKPRIKAKFAAGKFPVNQEMNLTADILDPDYLPATAAQTSVIIQSPDGQLTEIPMSLNSGKAGNYSEIYTPEQPGAYRTSIVAKFTDGSTVNNTAWFTAVFSGKEVKENAYREDLLRNIARITNGDFFHYTELKLPLDLKVSDKIPNTIKKIYWTNTWPFLIILLFLFVIEWYLRRRIGLK